jgi:hypothetical protein
LVFTFGSKFVYQHLGFTGTHSPTPKTLICAFFVPEWWLCKYWFPYTRHILDKLKKGNTRKKNKSDIHNLEKIQRKLKARFSRVCVFVNKSVINKSEKGTGC